MVPQPFGFNPLFIGEVSSTFRIPPDRAYVLEFQSPLHRGSLFNLISSCRKFVEFGCFNPLFIGEVSSTEGIAKYRDVRLPFQSPLHRGSLFNLDIEKIRPLVRLVDCDVSIPSSSGKSLQPRSPQITHAGSVCFNPLFIGEVSSTSNSPPGSASAKLFQSPLHRGSLFNKSHSGTNTRDQAGFNPLFIGEVSSTTFTASLIA